MALAAAQVVDAVAALLVPMVATGGRVYTSRAWPLSDDDLPAWRVTAEDESVELLNLNGTEQEHVLQINVTATARAAADLDDTLHALAASGLTLLFANPPYGLELQGIERDMSTEGEAAVGRIVLRLRSTFHTAPSAPETIL